MKTNFSNNKHEPCKTPKWQSNDSNQENTKRFTLLRNSNHFTNVCFSLYLVKNAQNWKDFPWKATFTRSLRTCATWCHTLSPGTASMSLNRRTCWYQIRCFWWCVRFSCSYKPTWATYLVIFTRTYVTHLAYTSHFLSGLTRISIHTSSWTSWFFRIFSTGGSGTCISGRRSTSTLQQSSNF